MVVADSHHAFHGNHPCQGNKFLGQFFYLTGSGGTGRTPCIPDSMDVGLGRSVFPPVLIKSESSATDLGIDREKLGKVVSALGIT